MSLITGSAKRLKHTVIVGDCLGPGAGNAIKYGNYREVKTFVCLDCTTFTDADGDEVVSNHRLIFNELIPKDSMVWWDECPPADPCRPSATVADFEAAVAASGRDIECPCIGYRVGRIRGYEVCLRYTKGKCFEAFLI